MIFLQSKYSSSLETIKEEDKFQGDNIEKLIYPPIGQIFDENDQYEGSVADNEDEEDEHVSGFHNE